MAKAKKKTTAKKLKIKAKVLKGAKPRITHKIPARLTGKIIALPIKPVVKKKVKVDPAFVPLLKKLQGRRNEITGQVSHLEKDLREDIADNQNVPGDMADHGSGELNQHLSVTLMENDRVELERIERAISRIEEGSYGECEVCQKTIPMARLKAIPWATRCIACQSRAEGF
jgi:DnaK suppressor protein